MKHLWPLLTLGAALTAAPIFAADIPKGALSAEVVFLGEYHDNPDHHLRQAAWVTALAPSALVFEMLPEGIDVPYEMRTDAQTLGTFLDWDARGWPDFAMYYPVFAAAPMAAIHGAAIPRDKARALMEQPLDAAFGPDSARFGLDKALPPEQQAAREALQQQAHCDAMPAEMLPVMVNIQRMRDAALAQAAAQALERYGPPVVVITGNGHARKDWGAPAALAHAETLRVFSLGQSEDGMPVSGIFDALRDAPGQVRDDPCAAFR